MRHLNLTATALLAVTAIAATQCTTHNSGDTAPAITGTVTIDVSDTPYNPAEWFGKTERIELITDSATFLQRDMDLCLTDSAIYIADWGLTVTAFDRTTGRMIHRLEGRGQGPGEYANLAAVDARGDSVYLLDQYTMKVLVYDSGLNFHRTIDLGFPAIDMAKTDDGFVFFSCAHEPGQNRITVTDNDGHTTAAYLPQPAEELTGFMSGSKFLNINGRGELLFSPSFEPDIYRLTPDSLERLATIDLKDDHGPGLTAKDFSKSNTTCILKTFVTDNTLLVQYLANRQIHTYIRDLTTGKSVNGLFKFDYDRPCLPSYQHGNSIVTYLYAQDFADDEKMHFDNPDAEAVIYIYNR